MGIMQNNTTSPKPAEKAKEEVVKTEDGQKNWGVISAAVLALVLLLIFSLGGDDKAKLPEGCNEGDKFSQTTGEPCQTQDTEAAVVSEEDAALDAENNIEGVGSVEVTEEVAEPKVNLEACLEGEKYDRNTGDLCAGEEEVAAPAAAAVLATGTLGYDAALKQYVGKSVLVADACVPNTDKLEVAVGSRVLVANNSAKAQELSIQDRKVTLRPYHYMTSSVKVAGEFPVTCGGVAVATVVAK